MNNTANVDNRKWKVAIAVLSIFYSLLSLFAVPVFGAFLGTGATARVAALGDSYTAIADDAAALTVNPAGLSLLTRPQAVADYSRDYAGLGDGSQISQFYLGYAHPLSVGGSLGFGLQQLQFDGLYTERTLSIGYGRWLTQRLALGLSVKQLHHSFSPPQQVVDDFGNIQPGTPDFFLQHGTSQDAYSADMGILCRLSAKSLLGFSVQDMNEPNTALSSADRDVVSRTIRAGVSSEVRPRLTVAAGIRTQSYLADQRDWFETAGAEYWTRESESQQFGVRGSFAAGTRDYRQVAVGAGYRLGTLQLDYGFVFNLTGITLGDTYGTHRMTVTYRFGPPPATILLTAERRLAGPESHRYDSAVVQVEISSLMIEPIDPTIAKGPEPIQ